MPVVVAALIPARRGSKGVAGKNTTQIHGRSLVERAIDTALKVPEIDDIYVSTNDPCARTQAEARKVRLIDRPEELATDESPMVLTLRHAFFAMHPSPDIMVLLQPTTPSRTWQMVQNGIQLLRRNPDVDSVVSVVPVPIEFSPDLVMVKKSGRLVPFGNPASRRQEATPTWSRDGSFYVFRTVNLLQMGTLYGHAVMPYEVNPDASLNIDDEHDWERACIQLR
jgi:CMP-N,N'-diacetyllegionaminic acid synthase